MHRHTRRLRVCAEKELERKLQDNSTQVWRFRQIKKLKKKQTFGQRTDLELVSCASVGEGVVLDSNSWSQTIGCWSFLLSQNTTAMHNYIMMMMMMAMMAARSRKQMRLQKQLLFNCNQNRSSSQIECKITQTCALGRGRVERHVCVNQGSKKTKKSIFKNRLFVWLCVFPATPKTNTESCTQKHSKTIAKCCSAHKKHPKCFKMRPSLAIDRHTKNAKPKQTWPTGEINSSKGRRRLNFGRKRVHLALIFIHIGRERAFICVCEETFFEKGTLACTEHWHISFLESNSILD